MSQSGIYRKNLAPVAGSPEWSDADLILEIKQDQVINDINDSMPFDDQGVFHIDSFESVKDPYQLWDNVEKKVVMPCGSYIDSYFFSTAENIPRSGFQTQESNTNISFVCMPDSGVSGYSINNLRVRYGFANDSVELSSNYSNVGYFLSFYNTPSGKTDNGNVTGADATNFIVTLTVNTFYFTDYPITIPAGTKILFKIQSVSRKDLFNLPSIYGVPEGAINLFEGNLIEINEIGQDTTVSVRGISSGINSIGIRGVANSTGSIAIGDNSNVSGLYSISVGGITNVDGGSSVAVGFNAFVDGNQSSAFGGASQAMGNDVLALGVNAGKDQTNTSSSDNIYISNRGVDNESNTMRLGNNQINDTYVAGIYNASTSSNPLNVFAGDDGKLFTQNINYVEGIQAGDNVTVDETDNVYTINATSPVADIQSGTNITVDEAGGVYTIDGDVNELNLLEGNLINIVQTGDDRTIEVIGDSTGLNSVGIGSGAEALGDNQVAIGNNAGSSIVTGGTDSIYLRNDGVDTETNTMRLGDGQINDTYVSGIYGSDPVATNETVLVGNDGKLFGQTESAFYAHTSSNESTTGIILNISIDTVFFDVNSDFNTTTNEFTAPVDGIYNLTFVFQQTPDSNHTFTRIVLTAASNVFSGGNVSLFPAPMLASGSQYRIGSESFSQAYTESMIVMLDAGDTVSFNEVFLLDNSGTMTSQGLSGDPYRSSSFSGYLVKQL